VHLNYWSVFEHDIVREFANVVFEFRVEVTGKDDEHIDIARKPRRLTPGCRSENVDRLDIWDRSVFDPIDERGCRCLVAAFRVDTRVHTRLLDHIGETSSPDSPGQYRSSAAPGTAIPQSVYSSAAVVSSMITNAQIDRWLREDIGHHDVTNQVPGETIGRLVSKEPGVAAGIDAARAVFDYLNVDVREPIDDGTAIEAGDELLSVEGAARDVLRGERVAVNLAGHASGIATRTRRVVEEARTESADVRIAATRKTTPGLRGLEKRAVVAGGGDSHRLDLSHMVMVKDNHIVEMGLEGAISHFQERTSFATKIDVEVETVADAPRAAAAGADIVLLDNMTPAETREAVDRLHEAGHDDVLAEASGGITIETVADYAATGVDIISMGSLTHSAPSLDLSFRTGI